MTEELNLCIYQIYALSREGAVEDYQNGALRQLSKLLNFDCAWWGRASSTTNGHSVHCSFTYQMPIDVADLFNVSDPHNLVAQKVEELPGVAHVFNQQILYSEPSTANLSRHMNVQQIACICQIDDSTKVTNFLALGRRLEDSIFSKTDLKTLQFLLPHLSAGLDMSLAGQLMWRRRNDGSSVLACDTVGALRAMEPKAIQLLKAEFSNWIGPVLPEKILLKIKNFKEDFLGMKIAVSIERENDNLFLHLRPRAQVDFLTKREKVVARKFSAGKSYKEVAEALGISPATVRHHLRAIYTKLDVQDKAALANKLLQH
jgi:DNA-binding CsgD family transcriptional regulator